MHLENIVKLIYLQMYVSALVGSSYSDKAQIQILFDEMSVLGENIQTTGNSAASKTVDIFQKVLDSPKFQSALKFLPVKGREELVLRATIKSLDDSSMALVISVSVCQTQTLLFHSLA